MVRMRSKPMMWMSCGALSYVFGTIRSTLQTPSGTWGVLHRYCGANLVIRLAWRFNGSLAAPFSNVLSRKLGAVVTTPTIARPGRGRRAQYTALTSRQFPPDDGGTFGQCLEFGEGEVARDVFHAAIGGRDQPLGRQVLECR